MALAQNLPFLKAGITSWLVRMKITCLQLSPGSFLLKSKLKAIVSSRFLILKQPRYVIIATLEDNAGGVRVTIARWLTPEGRQIGEQGLEPEYIVEMTQEDFEQGLDPQLDKAIEVLMEIIQ